MHIETARVLAQIAEAADILDGVSGMEEPDVLEGDEQEALEFLLLICMPYMYEGVSMSGYYSRHLRALYPSVSKKNISEAASLLDAAVISQPLICDEKGSIVAFHEILFEYGYEIAEVLRRHMQAGGFSFFVKTEE